MEDDLDSLLTPWVLVAFGILVLMPLAEKVTADLNDVSVALEEATKKPPSVTVANLRQKEGCVLSITFDESGSKSRVECE